MRLDTSDPAGAEKLGIELARLVDGKRPSVVLISQTVEDAVLGHIVGRELGIPVIRIYDEEGLATSSSPIPSEAKAVLVSEATTEGQLIDAAKALLARAGGQLIMVAALTQLEGR